MGDLRNVLNGLKGISNTTLSTQNVSQLGDDSDVHFIRGETVAGAWYEDVGDRSEWHLGVVDRIADDGVYVSYMKRSDKNGFNWLFPGEADIQLTDPTQIIARKIKVATR